MASVYGAGVLTAVNPGQPLDYLTWCQLELNLERVELAQAVATARGMGIANGTDDVPLAYFDAVAATRKEAEEMAYETNASRTMARIKAQHRQG